MLYKSGQTTYSVSPCLYTLIGQIALHIQNLNAVSTISWELFRYSASSDSGRSIVLLSLAYIHLADSRIVENKLKSNCKKILTILNHQHLVQRK